MDSKSDSPQPSDLESSGSATCSTVAKTCDICGCEALIIVKAYVDIWEARDFDPHPDRDGVDEYSTDWHQDVDADAASHYAHGCPKCKRIVPGSHWIEP